MVRKFFAGERRRQPKGGSEIRLMGVVVALAAMFVLLLLAASALRGG